MSKSDTLVDAILASYKYGKHQLAIVLTEKLKNRFAVRRDEHDTVDEILSHKEFMEWVESKNLK